MKIRENWKEKDCSKHIRLIGRHRLNGERGTRRFKAKGLPDYRTYIPGPVDFLTNGTKALLISFLISYSFYKSILLFALSAPAAVLLYPFALRKKLCEKRKQELARQFREGISMVSGFLSAGCSVENAFSAAVPQLRALYGNKAMIVTEFETMLASLRVNRQLDSMLLDFSERSGLEDVRSFAEVFVTAKKTGGDLTSIIDRTVDVIREKMQVTEEIRNMTASRKYEQKIMNILPFVIVLYIDFSSEGYMDVMYTTTVGRAVMTVCLLLIGAACMLSEKILDIKI